VVNDKLIEARALRGGPTAALSRKEARAKAVKLEKEAQELLDHPKSYIVSKLMLVPTRETMRSLAPLNLMFAKWNVYTEERGEFVVAEVRFDPGMAREVHDGVAPTTALA